MKACNILEAKPIGNNHLCLIMVGKCKKKKNPSPHFFFSSKILLGGFFFFFLTSPTNFTITAVNFSSVLVVGKTELYRKICCDSVIVYTILFVLIRDPAIPLYRHFPFVLAIPSLLTFCSSISLYLIFHYLSPPLRQSKQSRSLHLDLGRM